MRPSHLGRPTVLVVDDSRTAQMQICHILQRLGYQYLTALDGRAGLDVLAEVSVDVVISDIEMPRMNGFEFLAAVQADQRLRHLPVLVLSAHDDIATVVRSIELGAADALPKPCHETLLQARLESCLLRKRWRDEEQREAARSASESARSGQLLANMLPDVIAARLKAGERAIADYHPAVTILFADIVGFTPLTAERSSADLVALLNALFSMFDVVAASMGLEKIKTVGDAYMVAAGIPSPRPDHAQAVARLAMEMHPLAARLAGRGDEPIQLHVGIHSGGVSAGVIGTQKFTYDVWGDTVNVASRLTTLAPPGSTLISPTTAQLLGRDFELQSLGPQALRGHGHMETYALIRQIANPQEPFGEAQP